MSLKTKSVLLIAAVLLGCGTPDVKLNKKSNHYDGDVFFNPTNPEMDKSIFQVIQWQWEAEPVEWPEWVDIEQKQVPQERVKPGELSVTFINHATVLVQLDGINILTDPVWSKRTSPVQWAGPARVKLPGVKFDDMPPIDIILISHNHFDAMDLGTLEKFMKRDKPKIFFGLGNAYYLPDEFKHLATEMDWEDSVTAAGLKITFNQCQHWSNRNMWDKNKSLWGAFTVAGTKKFYFAGDSGYASHFKATGKKHGPYDLALIPVGAYLPRWFMKAAHINPAEAVQVHRELNSQFSIGIHFGTFQLTDEGIDDPVKDLEKEKQKYPKLKPFITLENGQSKKLF